MTVPNSQSHRPDNRSGDHANPQPDPPVSRSADQSAGASFTRLVARHKWMSLCSGYMNEPYVIGGLGTFVVALNDKQEVLMITEPAIPDGKPVLTLPAGAIDEGEDPLASANRELQEEAGFKAARLDLLATLNPLGRHAVWDIYTYLARDLSPSRLPGDEAYEITTEWVPLADFEGLIASGRLTYAPIITALYLARSFLAREAGAGA